MTRAPNPTPPKPGDAAGVLVIDDDGSVRRIVCKALQQFGYTVLEAEDGESGIQTFGEHADGIQLVILDIVMPGLSGWDVLRAIKQQRPHVPVIVQSGYVASGTHLKNSPIEADAFLRKPYELVDLLQTVRRVLEAAKRRGT